MSELNAASSAVDAAVAATNNLTSRLNSVNASVTSLVNITDYDDHDAQISQLNSSCAYTRFASLKSYFFVTLELLLTTTVFFHIFTASVATATFLSSSLSFLFVFCQHDNL